MHSGEKRNADKVFPMGISVDNFSPKVGITRVYQRVIQQKYPIGIEESRFIPKNDIRTAFCFTLKGKNGENKWKIRGLIQNRKRKPAKVPKLSPLPMGITRNPGDNFPIKALSGNGFCAW